MKNVFGNLTLNNKKDELVPICDTKLNYIFKNSKKTLEHMTVIEAEREIAFQNLRKLTTELQTKRLRYNAKSACKYFTL